MEKLCERCQICYALPSQRFCKLCKKVVLQELKDSGYLKTPPKLCNTRSPDAKENVRDTKFGRDD